MHIIGRGRYAREGYAKRSDGALVALSNRYLLSATPAVPDPFTSLAAYFVAAANVTRRASGLFVVMAQVLSQSAAADSQAWAAILFPGGVASDGTVNGNWRVSIGTPVAVAPTVDPSVMGSDASELATAVGITLVGINPTPAPAGDSVIAIVASSIGPSQLTMGPISVSAFELP